MTSKTLTDELRSVLLFHALEAPEPNATVDRILAETVGPVTAFGVPGAAAGSAAGPDARPGRRRRLSAQQLLVASVIAVLLVSVAGINSVRNRNAARSTTVDAGRASMDQRQVSDAAEGSLGSPGSDDLLTQPQPPNPPQYAGNALDCSKIPDGRLVVGQWDDVTLRTGEQGYVYEFLCVGRDGQRSASEVQLFRLAGDGQRYQRTLLSPAADAHLESVVGGAATVRMQSSAQHRAPGREPGEIVATIYDLSLADPGDGSSFTWAEPCRRQDLVATVTAVPDAAAPAWLLALRNQGGRGCALEGFPDVRVQRGGRTLVAALPTLNGPVGGVGKRLVPPIILLAPGATASAVIEQSPASAAGSCAVSDELAVTLPSGVSLGQLPAQLSACGLVVHPLVGNTRGSD